MINEAKIPVDLYNPGQVLASVGFLEAAERLLGNAEGRFDWRETESPHFVLKAGGLDNPFEVVLRFLTRAKVIPLIPSGVVNPGDLLDAGNPVESSDTFPGPKWEKTSLPVQLNSADGISVCLGHWMDGSDRNTFKLYAGNRSAYDIARAMLFGVDKKSKSSKGVLQLLNDEPSRMISDPFNVLTPMGGSFNFDPRGAWKSIDAGYSPNNQGHFVESSPVVEILAAWGLEYARPEESEERMVRYAVWDTYLPLILARPVLSGASLGIPIRSFRFQIGLSGKNKIFTFSKEEVRS